MGNRPCWRRIITGLAIACLWGTLTSCSMLDVIKPKPGIAVDAQIGKNVEKTEGVKNETEDQSFAWEDTSVTINPENIEGGGL